MNNFDYMSNLDDGSVDMVITDYPYGTNFESNTLYDDSPATVFKNLSPQTTDMYRSLKEGGRFYAFVPDKNIHLYYNVIRITSYNVCYTKLLRKEFTSNFLSCVNQFAFDCSYYKLMGDGAIVIWDKTSQKTVSEALNVFDTYSDFTEEELFKPYGGLGLAGALVSEKVFSYNFV